MEGQSLTRSQEHARAPFEFNLFTLSTFCLLFRFVYALTAGCLLLLLTVCLRSVGLNNELIIRISIDKLLINW